MNLLSHSRLFDLTRSAKRLPNIALAAFMAFMFLTLGQLVGLPVFIVMQLTVNDPAIMDSQPLTQGIFFSLILIGSFTGALFLLWIWLKWFEKRPFYTLGFEAAGAVTKYARGFLFGLATFGASVSLIALFGDVSLSTNSTALSGVSAIGGVLVALTGWLVQGATEETVTRGWLMNVVAVRYRPWQGILLSSIVFMALHSFNNAIAPLPLINLFLFGLLAALFALWDDSLWGIAAWHGAWNWMQGNVLGLEVSGNHAGGGTLIDLQTTGPDLLTGGAFGPEGGLAVTTILVLSITFMFWLLSRTR